MGKFSEHFLYKSGYVGRYEAEFDVILDITSKERLFLVDKFFQPRAIAKDTNMNKFIQVDALNCLRTIQL